MLTAHKAAVLGSPVSHSLSPVLHRAAYAALQLDNWSYAAFDCPEERLPGVLSRAGAEWAGFSLTMPLKVVALDVAEEVSELARATGAANTLVRRAAGGWAADNTDVHGVEQALRSAGVTAAPAAVVVGSGATARSVVSALARLGTRSVTFVVRSQAQPRTLQLAADCGLDAVVTGPGSAARALGSAQAVVSTVPGGAHVRLALPAAWTRPGASTRAASDSGSAASPLPVVMDVVYAGWPTPFARAFLGAGATVVSGFEMLLHQAGEQVRLMTGLDAPLDQMRAAGLAAMTAARHHPAGAAAVTEEGIASGAGG